VSSGNQLPGTGRSRLEIVVGAAAVAAAAGVGVAASHWPGSLLPIALIAAAVAFVFLRTEIALLVLVASGALEFAISYGAQSTLTPTKLAGILCFLSFAFNTIVNRRKLVGDWALGFVLAILGVAMISTLTARDSSAAIATTTRYASFVALFFVISQYVREERLFGRVVWVLSIAASITGAVSVWSFLSGQTLLARTTYGDPNDIAFVLATTLPLTFWLLRERGLRRMLVMAMIAMIGLTILLTFSRGAMVGLGVALLWKVVAEGRQRGAIVAGVVAAIAAVGIVLAIDSGRVETGLKAKQKVAQENVATRLDAWDKAATFAAYHPLLGVGPGNFRVEYARVVDAPAGTKTIAVVHNAYLDIAAELGVIALILFVGYLIVVFGYATAAARAGLGPPGLADAVRTSLIVAILAALTLSEQYYAPFWLLGGLACAMWHLRDRQGQPEE
jgi:putative inorganic carbon (HCO3(-)) transporter